MKSIHWDRDNFPISFTTDIWTKDGGGDSFISWTALYINPTTYVHEEHVIQVCPFAGSHTAAAISEAFGIMEHSKVQNTHCCAWQCCQYDSRHWAEWPCSNRLCYSYPSGSYQRLHFGSTLCIWHVVKMLEDCWSLQTFAFGSGKTARYSTSAYLTWSQAYTRWTHLMGFNILHVWLSRWAEKSHYFIWHRFLSCQITWVLMNGILEKIVKFLEPMQCITKELSRKGTIVSQVIPFLEI